MSPSGPSSSTRRPVSSRVSRSAVSSRVSPASGVPLGRAHSGGRRRWTSAISVRPSFDRWTTPPADVARAFRRAATARLCAASALEPERQSGAAVPDATGGTDAGEDEATGRGPQRGHARRRQPRDTGPVIDRRRAIQPEPPAARARTAGAEVDGRVRDVAGRETHSHGRHCTPRPWRRKPSPHRCRSPQPGLTNSR